MVHRKLREIVVFCGKILYLFELWHRFKHSIQPENPSMIAAPKVGQFTGLTNQYGTPMRANIAETMDFLFIVPGEEQWFIQVILEQREGITLPGFLYHPVICNKLPALRKYFFPGFLEIPAVSVKFGTECFGLCNIWMHVKCKHDGTR